MFKKSWLKGCALFAVFFLGAAQLPAMAAACQELTAEEAAIQSKYADNMSKGLIKGFELASGKKVTPEQRAEIRRIFAETFPQIIAEVKKAGLYDEYKAQAFDPEIERMNEEAMRITSIAEVQQVAQKQFAYISEKYPRLTAWMNSSKEMEAIVTAMMKKIQGVLVK